MAWTTPTSRSTGDLITASIWNTDIVNDLLQVAAVVPWVTPTAIGAVSTDGMILANTTAAAAGAQQWSPRVRWTGQGWKTNSTAASQTVDWIAEVVPVQGAANPSSEWRLSSQINAGGYTVQLKVDSTGVMTTTNASLITPNATSALTGTWAATFANTIGSGDPRGIVVTYSFTPNSAASDFILCQDNSATRMEVRSNGGIANFSGNNVNLSDARTKTKFEVYTPQLLDAMAAALTKVDWGRYHYADQTHDDWNHGPTAQGVQAAFCNVADELVSEEFEIGGEARLGIYTHDLGNIVGAVVGQNVLPRIAQLEAELARLKARVH